MRELTDILNDQVAVLERKVKGLQMALAASDDSLNEYIEKTKLAEAELRAARELYAKESVPTEVERKGWVKHDDVPNIKAYSVFHRELDLPLVTRLPDGSWWVHPPIGTPVSPQQRK